VTAPTIRSVLSREIKRYERAAFEEDMRDPIRPSLWHTPRAMFSLQCAAAWREFAIAMTAGDAT
jgi:hypothetical protein